MRTKFMMLGILLNVVGTPATAICVAQLFEEAAPAAPPQATTNVTLEAFLSDDEPLGAINIANALLLDSHGQRHWLTFQFIHTADTTEGYKTCQLHITSSDTIVYRLDNQELYNISIIFDQQSEALTYAQLIEPPHLYCSFDGQAQVISLRMHGYNEPGTRFGFRHRPWAPVCISDGIERLIS